MNDSDPLLDLFSPQGNSLPAGLIGQAARAAAPDRQLQSRCATGHVGRHVVDVLRARGDDGVPILRPNGVDVIIGEGRPEGPTFEEWLGRESS